MSPWISHRFLRAQSDERLVGAAARGNARAFEMLVERHRASLLAHAQRMLGGSRAEDALQQGLLQAWVALQRDIAVRNPRAWLFRVVHNSAVDALRSARPEQTALSDSVRAPARVEADVEMLQAARDTLAGVAALPDLQREALLRTALDGHSHEHVGSALGVSADAVRGLVYRARTSLRAAASALVPPPLVGLLAGAHRRYASLRPAGPGQGGASQVLLERGAAIVSAGALAAGVVAARGPIAHHAHHEHVAAATPHAAGARKITAGVTGMPPESSTLADAASRAGSRGHSRTGTPAGSSGQDRSGGPGSAGTGLAPEGGSERQRQERGSHGEAGGDSSSGGADTRGGTDSEAGGSRSGEDGGGAPQEGSGSGSGLHDGSGDGGSGSNTVSGDGGSGSLTGSDGGSGLSMQFADGGTSSDGGSGSTGGSSSSGGSGGESGDGSSGSHDGLNGTGGG